MADEKKDPPLPRGDWSDAAAREEALQAAKDRLDLDVEKPTAAPRRPPPPRKVGSATIYGGPAYRDQPVAMPAYGAPPLRLRAIPLLLVSLVGAAIGFGLTGRASMAIVGFAVGALGIVVLTRLRR